MGRNFGLIKHWLLRIHANRWIHRGLFSIQSSFYQYSARNSVWIPVDLVDEKPKSKHERKNSRREYNCISSPIGNNGRVEKVYCVHPGFIASFSPSQDGRQRLESDLLPDGCLFFYTWQSQSRNCIRLLNGSTSQWFLGGKRWIF